MYAYHRLLILYLSAILYHVLATAAPANDKLPPSFSVEMLGAVHEPKSFSGVQRDGGGGGLVNGKHLIVFSDTSTIRDDKLVGFTSNSVAYVRSKGPLCGNQMLMLLDAVIWKTSNQTDRFRREWCAIPGSSLARQRDHLVRQVEEERR